MKKILVAMDSFKGTISSKELSEIIKKYIPNKDIDLNIIPMSDGGEGFVDSLSYSVNCQEQIIKVEDAFGNPITSKYVIINNNLALMEIAQSSGLGLIDQNKLNPYMTSSFGLGQTIIDALDKGANKIIIGLGGSSTNDGGSGMLKALGVKFFDKQDKEINRMTGLSISKVESIDISKIDPRLSKIQFEVACDVDNPLLGDNGCAYVYAKQKGATDSMIIKLEENMKHFSEIVAKTLEIDHKDFPGTGAAGGLGFALKVFLNASLKSGFDILSKMVDLEDKIISSDVVITGEGQFDKQSFQGKLPVKIAALAKKHHKQVIGLFGQSKVNHPLELFDGFMCVVPEISSKENSLKNPKENFIKLVKKIKI